MERSVCIQKSGVNRYCRRQLRARVNVTGCAVRSVISRVIGATALLKPVTGKIAVMGATGAGKSTLSKFLYRFFDVTTGSVRIDGYDVRNVTQPWISFLRISSFSIRRLNTVLPMVGLAPLLRRLKGRSGWPASIALSSGYPMAMTVKLDTGA